MQASLATARSSVRWPVRLAVAYVLCELWRLYRFRRLLRRLRVRHYAHKGGDSFLAWARGVVMDSKTPIILDREFFERFTAEEGSPSVGYGGGRLNWQRLYSWWAWGCGRPFDAQHDPELHATLLECAGRCCSAMGLAPPPADAPPQPVPAVSPFGFGICDIRATFTPLPVRAFLRAVLLGSRLGLRAMGFRRLTEPMPEGDLVCWTDLPRGGKAAGGEQRPVVFMHGLGLGNLTYLPLFQGPAGRAWRPGGCVLLELPCMTSASACLEHMPLAAHSADALGRLLREQLGYGDFEYDVVCHSLSAYLAAILCNEGSPCRPRRTVLIDPVCFLDGVEVCGRFPFRTPQECRTFAESTVLFPSFLPMAVRRLFGHLFRHFVCRNIFTQYSVLRWNGTDATSIFWRNASADALVCLSDADNFVPAARVARHCEAHFPRIKRYHMPGKDHGSFVIEGALRAELLQRMALFLSSGE